MRIFNKKAQKGASLLEVLIALFVLAVGLLGVLSLQAESLRFNQQAHSASQALFLANDLVERMRLNTKGEYATNQATPLVGVNPCKTNSCDSAALASADLAEWASNIAARLPGGLGNVSRVAGVGQGSSSYAKIVSSEGPWNARVIRRFRRDQRGYITFNERKRPGRNPARTCLTCSSETTS